MLVTNFITANYDIHACTWFHDDFYLIRIHLNLSTQLDL